METSAAEKFMARARAMRDAAVASGDQPYGAVVVRGGELIVSAPSQVVVTTDPTAHAEMAALRAAALALGRADLDGCTLYSTSRPCPMCETAAAWAGIERMIHGDALHDAGRPRVRRC
ncbi:MAG: nucleoside deaminase [Gammaproteobacteria bacterium]|nr:MAG: nucleoside deaminase [Gammaproteobacteria bacterium]